jgi:Domain of unknown function (DUF6438)
MQAALADAFNNTNSSGGIMREEGMVQIRCVFLLAIVLAFIFPQSKPVQTANLDSLSDDDLKAAVIRMERTRCFGSCPAYILTIYGDGRVEYISKEDKKAAAKQGTIAPGAVKALLAQFASAKFLSLPDYLFEECTCRQCTDLPSTITEINVQGTTHRVRHDYGCGCAPEALFELESAIDKAANVEQWTGDTSKRGPAGTTCFQPKDLKH